MRDSGGKPEKVEDGVVVRTISQVRLLEQYGGAIFVDLHDRNGDYGDKPHSADLIGLAIGMEDGVAMTLHMGGKGAIPPEDIDGFEVVEGNFGRNGNYGGLYLKVRFWGGKMLLIGIHRDVEFLRETAKILQFACQRRVVKPKATSRFRAAFPAIVRFLGLGK